MILVTGATGTVGSEVVRALRDLDAPVRALVRTPERADLLRGMDVDIAFGDFADSDSLDHALRRVDHVFLISPASEQQVEQETAVIAAIRSAATEPHVVKLAVAGVDQPDTPVRLARNHQQIVDRLREEELPHTVLAPNDFMQNLLRDAASVQEQGALYGPYGDAAVSLVDVRDVAAVAAHALTTEGHAGAVYTITGPEAVTWSQVAAAISEVAGREVRYVDVPPEQARSSMVGAGTPEWLADGLLELAAVYREGGGSTVTDEVTKATGRPAHTVADFLAHHRAAFA